jgi:hypothetical protein
MPGLQGIRIDSVQKSSGGICHLVPYSEQGLSNVKTFASTMRDESIAGKLM